MAILAGGARQVVECAPKDPAQTSVAHAAERARCAKCRDWIARRPFHQVKDNFYHVECTRTF